MMVFMLYWWYDSMCLCDVGVGGKFGVGMVDVMWDVEYLCWLFVEYLVKL